MATKVILSKVPGHMHPSSTPSGAAKVRHLDLDLERAGK